MIHQTRRRRRQQNQVGPGEVFSAFSAIGKPDLGKVKVSHPPLTPWRNFQSFPSRPIVTHSKFEYSTQGDSILRDESVLRIGDSGFREKLLLDHELTLAKAMEILRT